MNTQNIHLEICKLRFRKSLNDAIVKAGGAPLQDPWLDTVSFRELEPLLANNGVRCFHVEGASVGDAISISVEEAEQLLNNRKADELKRGYGAGSGPAKLSALMLDMINHYFWTWCAPRGAGDYPAGDDHITNPAFWPTAQQECAARLVRYGYLTDTGNDCEAQRYLPTEKLKELHRQICTAAFPLFRSCAQ